MSCSFGRDRVSLRGKNGWGILWLECATVAVVRWQPKMLVTGTVITVRHAMRTCFRLRQPKLEMRYRYEKALLLPFLATLPVRDYPVWKTGVMWHGWKRRECFLHYDFSMTVDWCAVFWKKLLTKTPPSVMICGVFGRSVGSRKSLSAWRNDRPPSLSGRSQQKE